MPIVNDTLYKDTRLGVGYCLRCFRPTINGFCSYCAEESMAHINISPSAYKKSDWQEGYEKGITDGMYKLYENLKVNMKSLDPEFSKFVDEHFLELIG